MAVPHLRYIGGQPKQSVTGVNAASLHWLQPRPRQLCNGSCIAAVRCRSASQPSGRRRRAPPTPPTRRVFPPSACGAPDALRRDCGSTVTASQVWKLAVREEKARGCPTRPRNSGVERGDRRQAQPAYPQHADGSFAPKPPSPSQSVRHGNVLGDGRISVPPGAGGERARERDRAPPVTC
eukprot:355022-Chlamydomonas_euryale.AAC.5